jgi:hypothetical protein
MNLTVGETPGEGNFVARNFADEPGSYHSAGD